MYFLNQVYENIAEYVFINGNRKCIFMDEMEREAMIEANTCTS